MAIEREKLVDALCDEFYKEFNPGQMSVKIFASMAADYILANYTPKPAVPTDENYKQILFDLVDEHFPKGKSKERGAAMVLVAEALMAHEVKPAVPGDGELEKRIEAAKQRAKHRFHESHDDGDLAIAQVVREIKAIYASQVAAAQERAEGIGKYVAVSLLSMHVGYLLEHRRQGLPEMTSQVIGELWDDMKKITSENEKYMRLAAQPKEGKQL